MQAGTAGPTPNLILANYSCLASRHPFNGAAKSSFNKHGVPLTGLQAAKNGEIEAIQALAAAYYGAQPGSASHAIRLRL
jgi:hypothetical protein